MTLHQLDSTPGSLDDALQTAALAQRLGSDWVVIDGYHFGTEYQHAIKDTGIRLLVIDDYVHAGHYAADLVLNQNIYADDSLYSRRSQNTSLLLGTQYALLRREFLRWRGWQREISEIARKIVVTLGGGDPDNVTLSVVQALRKIDNSDLEVQILFGPANTNLAGLRNEISDRPNYRLITNATNVPDLMAWADIAVAAGGSTCWELAFMGLPSLLVVVADNQRAVAENLANLGVSQNMGWHADVSEEKWFRAIREFTINHTCREAMRDKGRCLVDGLGAARVAAEMGLARVQDVYGLRSARWEDAGMLWVWANDPTVRANSFHADPIPLDEHLVWYKKKLASSDTSFWIIEDDRMPVAQIRYDRVDESTAKINFSVASNHRGKGIGSKSILLTYEIACKSLGVRRADGIVFLANKASQHAFVKAGFRNIGQRQVSGILCYVFVKECPSVVGERI